MKHRWITALLLCLYPFAAARSQHVGYTVPEPTYKLMQPSPNSCWATAATMLVSWKAGHSMTTDSVMTQAGPHFAQVFRADTGLLGEDKAPFLAALQLKAEPPASYSAQALESALKRWGLLWVTTNEAPGTHVSVHGRILSGILGDSSGDGTTLLLIDPDDGKTHTETLTAFTAKLESVARLDYGQNADVRPLIVHF